MMQRLTFPFPFVHHQTHDWLLSVLEWHLCSSQKERGLMMVQHFQDLQPEDEEKSKGEKAGNLLSGNVWKVEQLLTVETRTYLMIV